MLWLRTKDTWSTVTMDFDDGLGAQTWTAPATVHSAHEALEDLTAWLDSTFAGEASSWTWVDDNLGGAMFQVLTSGTYEVPTVSAAAQTLLGSAATYPAGSSQFDGTAAMSGTFSPGVDVAVRQWDRSPAFSGKAGGAGAIGHPAPGGAHRRPIVSAVCTWLEALHLTAVLSNARHPRQAYLHDADASAWRGVVTLGAVRRERAGFNLVRVRCEVLA